MHAALANPLHETSFVVVDLETTGGSPTRGDRIIEIGAVRLVHGQVVARFQQLVNPGRTLPYFISRLTGITDDMLADEPPIESALEQFLGFAGTDILVAHNARFDMAFLNWTLRETLGQPIPQPHLCTLRLARRLLPEVRRHSLEALAGRFGIPVIDRHRALGDAIMTAEVLVHFLELLTARGISSVGQALALQYQASDGRRFICPLPRTRVERLPAAPGIYRFYDTAGCLLYVGKAKNLRQRVSTYLSNAAGHSRKTLDLIRHIHDVQESVTGSELEAALLEAEEIRRCQPPYNRLRKHLPRIAFLKLTVADVFPRLSLTSRLNGRTARYFGPFRSRAAAQQALDLLVRLYRLRTCAGRLHPAVDFSPCFQGQVGACSTPCTTRVDATEYQQQVADLVQFFDTESDAIPTALLLLRDTHSRALRFEAAARVQRDLELLTHMRRRQQRLSWIVARQHFVVMQPLSEASGALIYAVAHGRLVERCVARSATDLRAVAARLGAYLGDPTQQRLRPEDVDGTTILAAWLPDRGERDGYVFPVDATQPLNQQVPEWTAAFNSLLCTSTAPAEELS